jgi:sugar lactone lactonase YvrE
MVKSSPTISMPKPHQDGGKNVANTKTTSGIQSWLYWLLSFFITVPTATTMTDYQTWKVTEPWLDIHCGLGEAPCYEAATNTLRFVDIKKKRLHTVSITEGPSSLKTLQLDMPVGVTADIEGVDPTKKILVGGKHGIYILDRETGKYGLLKRFYDSEEKDDRLRSNDGAVDPQGRFWIGTMNDFHVGEPQAEGVHLDFIVDIV